MDTDKNRNGYIEMIPWAPEVNSDNCRGCGACLEVCQNGVFVMNEVEGKMKAAHPENCLVMCVKCTEICPNQAIFFLDKEGSIKLALQLRRVDCAP